MMLFLVLLLVGGVGQLRRGGGVQKCELEVFCCAKADRTAAVGHVLVATLLIARVERVEAQHRAALDCGVH